MHIFEGETQSRSQLCQTPQRSLCSTGFCFDRFNHSNFPAVTNLSRMENVKSNLESRVECSESESGPTRVEENELSRDHHYSSAFCACQSGRVCIAFTALVLTVFFGTVLTVEQSFSSEQSPLEDQAKLFSPGSGHTWGGQHTQRIHHRELLTVPSCCINSATNRTNTPNSSFS